jgi:hypothetical protein
MIKPDQIPRESVEVAKSVYTAEIYKGNGTALEYHTAMMKAIAACINSWPEVLDIHPNRISHLLLAFDAGESQ